MKKLPVEKYWELFARFLVARKSQQAVVAQTDAMKEILPDEPNYTRLLDDLGDAIYALESKEDIKAWFDEIISKCAVDVEWIKDEERP